MLMSWYFVQHFNLVSVRDALLSVTGSMLTWCNWTISDLNDYAETMLMTSVDCRSEWEIQSYTVTPIIIIIIIF